MKNAMIKSRLGWLLIAQFLMLALPVMAQQPRQSEIAAVAQIYGYNLAEGNWTYSQAACEAMPGFIMFHYHRRYPDGAESNFTAIVPRSFGHVRIVPVLYHGATPFVPAPRNPRNLALFNSLAAPVNAFGPGRQNQWFERASCYAEMTGGNNFLATSIAGPRIAGQPSPTVRVTIQDKAARVLFAERDSDHSYREWNLLFNRDGKIKSAQTQEQSVYVPRVARAAVPSIRPEMQSPRNASASTAPVATGETARESVRLPAQISTLQPQQRAFVNESQDTGSETAGAELSQPGWKLILNPPKPPSKFIPNAPAPSAKTIPNPSTNVQ